MQTHIYSGKSKKLPISSDILRLISLFFFSCLLIKVGQYLLVDEELYYNAYSGQLSYDHIKDLIDRGKQWEWIKYIFIPVFYSLKLTLVAGVIAIGSYLTTNQFYFKQFFGAAIFAELIFLLPVLIKLLWFLFVQTDYNLHDLNLFYPLSLLNITGIENIPSYWLYPLQTLNLFEIAYWLLLAHGVSEVTGQSFRQGFGLVISSYGTGLLLWIVLIMFLTITYA